MYSIVTWRFPIWYFLVLVWVSQFVFPLSSLLRVLIIVLSCSFSIWHFSYVLLVAILYGFYCIRLLVYFCIMSPNKWVEFFFVVLECPVLSIVLPFVDISLIFLLSLVLFDLFLQVYCLIYLLLLFPFCLYMFHRLSFVLSFWPVFVDIFFLRCQSNLPSWFRFFLHVFWGDYNFLTN